MYMLWTDSQLPDRFKAIKIVLRPPGPYTGNYLYSIVSVYFATKNKDAIKSMTSMDGYKKVVRLQQTDTFKVVRFMPSKQMVLK